MLTQGIHMSGVRARSSGAIRQYTPGASHYYLPYLAGRQFSSSKFVTSCACFSAATLQAAQGIIFLIVQTNANSIIGIDQRPIKFIGISVFFYIGEWTGMAIYRGLRRYENIYLVMALLTTILATIQFAVARFPQKVSICMHFYLLLSGILHTWFFYLSDMVASAFSHRRMHHFVYAFMWAFKIVVELFVRFILHIIKKRSTVLSTAQIIQVGFYALILCVFLSCALMVPAFHRANIFAAGFCGFERANTIQYNSGIVKSLLRIMLRFNKYQYCYLLAASAAAAITYNSIPLYYYYQRTVSIDWTRNMAMNIFQLMGVICAAVSARFLQERMIVVTTVALECIIFHMALLFPQGPKVGDLIRYMYSFAEPAIWFFLQSVHTRVVSHRLLHISQSITYVVSGFLALIFQSLQFVALMFDNMTLNARVLLSMAMPYFIIWVASQVMVLFYPAKV